jgi:hypothetical protein
MRIERARTQYRTPIAGHALLRIKPEYPQGDSGGKSPDHERRGV